MGDKRWEMGDAMDMEMENDPVTRSKGRNQRGEKACKKRKRLAHQRAGGTRRANGFVLHRLTAILAAAKGRKKMSITPTIIEDAVPRVT